MRSSIPATNSTTAAAQALKEIREAVVTTTPGLTETFHMLGPASIGSDRLREFIESVGCPCGSLIERGYLEPSNSWSLYADPPMDLADASLVAAAEALARGECSPSIARTSRRIVYAAGIATTDGNRPLTHRSSRPFVRLNLRHHQGSIPRQPLLIVGRLPSGWIPSDLCVISAHNPLQPAVLSGSGSAISRQPGAIIAQRV